MAVGENHLSTLHQVQGIRVGTVSAGIKKPGRRDLVLFEIVNGAQVAGVYTSNAFCAAPVQITRRHMERANPRYFMINTGNANAGTGDRGIQNALTCCRTLAELTGVTVEQVLPFSTGVIGEPLPVDKLCRALPEAVAALDGSGWEDAAHGIMTTDTRPKAVSRKIQVKGGSVTITGIAKGAGMIKPNMATMLGFIATDACIGKMELQDLLDRACRLSFNRITVDGDTSTNDCCMLIASGESGVDVSGNGEFEQALFDVFTELAKGLIRDAEGATKLVTVGVEGARTEEEALKVAYTVAESPLVKTALFASDPNWGRILAAVGRAGLTDLDIKSVDIFLGDVCIVSGGGLAENYREVLGAEVMAQDEVSIRISLGRGQCVESVWTCDFSYDYVKINAEYRT